MSTALRDAAITAVRRCLGVTLRVLTRVVPICAIC